MNIHTNPERGGQSYTSAQMITATSSLQRAVAALREFIMDSDITDAQLHVITLIGSRDLLIENGNRLDPMIVSRLRDLLEDEFGITDTAAENVIKSLETELGLIEKRPMEGHGVKKTIHLTEAGMALYKMSAQYSADLILTAAKLIQRDGPVPADPQSGLRGFFKDYGAMIEKGKKEERNA